MPDTKHPADPPEMTFKPWAGPAAGTGLRRGQRLPGHEGGADHRGHHSGSRDCHRRVPRLGRGVLEQNITRTAASVGEALVAGAIFHHPAFMMVEMDGKHLWADLRTHYWQSVAILLVAG